jgi:ABC-2 type transport system permease protein
MTQLFGVFCHEFGMSLRRPGLWVAYGLIFTFYTISTMYPSPAGETLRLADDQLWQYAGRMGYVFNLFLPVVAGILASDRMQRDFKNGVRELQASAPFTEATYVIGKYFGVLCAALLPVLGWVWLLTGLFVFNGNASLKFLPAMTASFFAILLPAFAFVTAFSLACPLVMPLRVYQILFTGYWFWGNYINPKVFPTLNGTLLTPGGMHAFQGYFGGFPGSTAEYTAADATMNLIVLGLCIVAALVMLQQYLQWQARRA